MKISISEILRGCQTGRLQSVGFMQVVPLISEMNDDRFGLPTALEVETRGYGNLVFTNPENKTTIIPSHAAYVVKQAAQDHAMATAGMVSKKNRKTYDNAMCIQQRQGGSIGRAKHTMLILPYPLRESATEKRKTKEFGKLWNDIEKMNSDFGTKRGGAHLEFFLENFRKELDEFVAEFECVYQQVGAIILVDGKIIGVERAPSYEYWKSVWPTIIRECYGSMAIRASQLKKGAKPKSRSHLKVRGKSIAAIKKALEQARDNDEEYVKKVIRDLISDPFDREKQEEVDGMIVENVSHPQLSGQIVRDDEKIVYASLVTKQKHLKNSDWRQAAPFTV